ncbi:hypothetical protein [Clostridium estertheticum]|nr:hypothetical protein [Clostridium estertheticum]
MKMDRVVSIEFLNIRFSVNWLLTVTLEDSLNSILGGDDNET